MKHTSTEQPEALRFADKLEGVADANVNIFSTRLALRKSAAELRRLHAESELHQQELASYRFTVENREARIAELEAIVQELEVQTAHMADLVELADYATKKLEASQARVPLNARQRRAIFDDLYPHGALPQTWKNFSVIVDAVEKYRITQEKQG